MKGHGSLRCGRWSGCIGCAVLAFFVFAFAVGCKKSPGPEQTAAGTQTNAAVSASVPSSPADTIARLHWLGKKRLAGETNAATFMSIWNLPESGAVEAQFLDKWAVALGSGYWFGIPSPELKAAAAVQPTNFSASVPNSLGTNAQSTNPSPALAATLSPSDGERGGVRGSSSSLLAYESLMTNYQQTVTAGSPALLRPLLNDLVQEETYLEVRQPTNQPAELVLAIKLGEDRAALWQKTLAAALEALTGAKVAASPDGKGWKVQLSQPSTLSPQLALIRSGAWTLIGWSGKADRIALLDELSGRVKSGSSPFPQPSTLNPHPPLWLDAQFDLRRLSDALSFNWHLPEQWPRIALTATGDGTNVLTRAQLNFPKPLPFQIEPWDIPTNLIHGPLVSLTAIQGLRPWLSSLGFWNNLGEPPNQVCIWGQRSMPLLVFLSYPSHNSSNFVSRFTELLMSRAESWLFTNRIGTIERSSNSNGFTITGGPHMAPFMHSVADRGREFVYAGLAKSSATNAPPMAPVLAALSHRTNVVFYEGETTGPRLSGLIYATQLIRTYFRRDQFPSESPAMNWFNAAAPKIGESVSMVTRSSPEELSFVRNSTVGFTSIELHLLAEWLESPLFPVGLRTLVVPPLPSPGIHHRTNSVVVPH